MSVLVMMKFQHHLLWMGPRKLTRFFRQYTQACLLNNMFANSIFPEAEKIAKVIPIYKSNERKQITNYRPISILPVLSKLIERVIYEELYQYLEEENRLLSSKQFGFRRGSSTQHAVLYLTDSIKLNMDKSNITGAVFLDLDKVFDTVDHARLLSKLRAYGLHGSEQAWFNNYLFNRKQFVCYDGMKLELETVSCAVPRDPSWGH